MRIPSLTPETIAPIIALLPPHEVEVQTLLSISQLWRNAALTHLSQQSTIPFTDLFPPPRFHHQLVNPPPPQYIIRILSYYCNAKQLFIRSYRDPFRLLVVSELITDKFPKLELIQFVKTNVHPDLLGALFSNIPSLKAFRLDHHDTFEGAINILEAYTTKLQLYGSRTTPRLTHVSISNCNLSRHLVQRLISKSLCHNLSIVNAHGFTKLSIQPRTIQRCSSASVSTQLPMVDSLSIIGCEIKLAEYRRKGTDLDIQQLNFSSCLRLECFDIRIHIEGPETCLAIKSLNFSQCKQLRYITTLSPQREHKFPCMEELILSSCCKLSSYAFKLFNLHSMCTMPKLRRLDLCGTSITELSLVGYHRLLTVDCSGCNGLTQLTVKQCWALELLNVQGKKVCPTMVDVAVLPSCRILGVKMQWRIFQPDKLIRYALP